jgi:non-specific serine/threonine protein kinase
VCGLNDLERRAVDPDNKAELLAARAPPRVPRIARSVPDAATATPHSVRNAWLPKQLSTFIGRQREIAEVDQLMEAFPLLTLTGPGGIGKTRVALQVASATANACIDEVHFVELAPTTNQHLVVHTVASELGLREHHDQPLATTLVEALQPKACLLVLDNCEHLLQACAALADGLLRACPKLRVLATSREPLGIAGEVVYRVPTLAVPEPGGTVDELAQTDAVRLFVERARAVVPGFSVTDKNVRAVLQVCRELDGIPLAIELAAARVRVLSPEQIAERLSDRFHLLVGGSRTAPPRQQTLAATLEWSYGLLTEPERRLFERLSVFAGGWTIQAAESVCAESEIRIDSVLDLLTQLFDKSLVLTEPGASGELRYGLLETLREYAHVRLVEHGGSEVASRQHAGYCLDLAQRAAAQFRTAEQMIWLDTLEWEQDNLRAALAWSIAHRPGTGLRLTIALADFWRTRGHLGEGELWLKRALQSAKRASPTLRGRALGALGNLLLIRGKLAEARSCLAESLKLFRQAGVQPGIAEALRGLGFAVLNAGEVLQAESMLADALALFRTSGDVSGAVGCMLNLADAAVQHRDYERASALLEESFSLAKDLEDTSHVAYGLHTLGHIAWARGDPASALPLLERSLLISRDVGDRRGIAACLQSMALVADAAKHPDVTTRLSAVATRIRAAGGLGAHGRLWLALDQDRGLAQARAVLGDQAFESAWQAGLALTLDDAVTEALSVAADIERSAPDYRPEPPGERLPERLTPREWEVVQLVAQGMTNRQIGEALVIAQGTASLHVKHVLAKLGLNSRVQVATWVTARSSTQR